MEQSTIALKEKTLHFVFFHMLNEQAIWSTHVTVCKDGWALEYICLYCWIIRKKHTLSAFSDCPISAH